jgi:hypothetical protein
MPTLPDSVMRRPSYTRAIRRDRARIAQVRDVDAGLAQDALDGGDAQPVDPIVAVHDLVPPGPAMPDDLDAPRAIRRRPRALDRHGWDRSRG